MPRLGLANVPTCVLKKELQQRLEALPKLIAQRDELNRRIAELEAPGAAEKAPEPASAPAPRKRGRPAKPAKSGVSLADALAEIIKAKDSVSVAEAAEAVLASGFKSKAEHFRTMVSMALSNDKRFERVARGVYRVKG